MTPEPPDEAAGTAIPRPAADIEPGQVAAQAAPDGYNSSGHCSEGSQDAAHAAPERRDSSGHCSEGSQAKRFWGRQTSPGRRFSRGSYVSEGQMSTSSRRSSSKEPGVRGFMVRLARHRLFDTAMCVIVVANCVTIGMEQAYRLHSQDTSFFDILEHGFLAVYSLELVLRFHEGRLTCLYNNWVRFDATIVFAGILTTWILMPIMGQSNQLSSLLVLRMARLLRLARTLKLVMRCRELLMLVQGLLNSVSVMFYTFLLCGVILYVLGCMSLELIPLAMMAKDEAADPEILEIAHNNFRSLPVAMLSLVQFITFDNVVYIYKPLIEYDATLAIFFMGVILVVGVVFMNLVTAIIVNTGVEQAMQDKDVQKSMLDSKRKKLIRSLKEAFYRADADCSGEITREELQEINQEDKDLLKNVLGIEDLTELFDSLDVDGDGEIGIDEFCKGIEKIAVSESSLELKRMERLLESMHRQLKESQRVQDDLRQSLQTIEASMQRPPSTGEALLCGAAGVPEASETKIAGPLAASSAWTRQLSEELREACTADVRRAMDEACASFMSQVCDGHLSRPEPPRAADDVRSDAGGCTPNVAGPYVFAGPQQKPGGRGWEALPPQKAAEAAPSPRRGAAAPRRRPEPAAAHGHVSEGGGARTWSPRSTEDSSPRPRGSDGSSQPPPGGRARPPRLGGFVPESGRPTLLSAFSAADTEVHGPRSTTNSHGSQREEL